MAMCFPLLYIFTGKSLVKGSDHCRFTNADVLAKQKKNVSPWFGKGFEKHYEDEDCTKRRPKILVVKSKNFYPK